MTQSTNKWHWSNHSSNTQGTPPLATWRTNHGSTSCMYWVNQNDWNWLFFETMFLVTVICFWLSWNDLVVFVSCLWVMCTARQDLDAPVWGLFKAWRYALSNFQYITNLRNPLHVVTCLWDFEIYVICH